MEFLQFGDPIVVNDLGIHIDTGFGYYHEDTGFVTTSNYLYDWEDMISYPANRIKIKNKVMNNETILIGDDVIFIKNEDSKPINTKIKTVFRFEDTINVTLENIDGDFVGYSKDKVCKGENGYVSAKMKDLKAELIKHQNYISRLANSKIEKINNL